jgi:hypothetical protein
MDNYSEFPGGFDEFFTGEERIKTSSRNKGYGAFLAQ